MSILAQKVKNPTSPTGEIGFWFLIASTFSRRLKTHAKTSDFEDALTAAKFL